MLFSFTVEHFGQPVAVIASGEIRAVPKDRVAGQEGKWSYRLIELIRSVSFPLR